MSQAKNSTEVLIAVKWMLENIGWTQHSFFRTKKGYVIGTTNPSPSQMLEIGSMCLSGAHMLVEAPCEMKFEARKRLILYGSLTSFNDTPGRTKEEVIALIDEAIGEKS